MTIYLFFKDSSIFICHFYVAYIILIKVKFFDLTIIQYKIKSLPTSRTIFKSYYMSFDAFTVLHLSML